MNKVTAMVISAPPAFMVLAMFIQPAAAPLCIASLICAVACLGWGIRTLQTQRRLACVCIGLAVLYFALLCLPFILPPRYGGEGACDRIG